MHFTDDPIIYHIERSADFPDAETLIIPLMRIGIIGLPIRAGPGADWLLVSYQFLDHIPLFRRLSGAQLVVIAPAP